MGNICPHVNMWAQCMFWILIKVTIIDVDLFDNFQQLKDAIMQNAKTQEEVVWEFSTALSSITFDALPSHRVKPT